MNDESVYLVLLETSGNQSYIFSTNKLRDVVGASELTHQVGTNFVENTLIEMVRGASEQIHLNTKEHLENAFLKVFNRKPFRVAQLMEEPAIEQGKCQVEVITATSGKALLLIRGRDQARSFISAWSRLVLTESPGVDAAGVISAKPVDFSLNLMAENETAIGISAAVKQVHEQFESARVLRIAPQARFAQVPIVAQCAISGLPASELRSEGNNRILVSKSSAVKWDARQSETLRQRMEGLYDDPIQAFRNLDEMEKHLESNWIGVIHADGNGLGQIFLNFGDHIQKLHPGAPPEKINRHYIHSYREFSLALDQICRQAYRTALSDVLEPIPVGKRQYRAIIPIVVGGDDLTVLIDGLSAIPFAKRFVEVFRELSAQNHVIQPIAKLALGSPFLGMTAGVLIAKAHFPFSVSYHLAEQLLRSAKQVKEKVNHSASALDFHILYDSSASDMTSIRQRYEWNDDKQGPVRRTAKPLVVAGASPDLPWARHHGWQRFQNAVSALKHRVDDKLSLPSTQSHQVRESLFSDSFPSQEARWNLLMTLYPEFKTRWQEGKLYRTIPESNPVETDTVFLDALEAAAFMPDHPPTQTPGGLE